MDFDKLKELDLSENEDLILKIQAVHSFKTLDTFNINPRKFFLNFYFHHLNRMEPFELLNFLQGSILNNLFEFKDPNKK